MDKKHALPISLILTLLIATNIFVLHNLNEIQTSTAIVKRVIDGDTIVLSNGENVRLINVNSPERARPGYEGARQFLARLQNQTVEIQRIGFDKYGRTLARVYFQGYVNLDLVEEGFANKYLVRDSEIEEFSEAEKNAIENEKGIWKRSDSFNCLETTMEKESISLTSNCATLQTTGWRLKDESRKEYNFPDLIIDKDETFAFKPEISAIWNEKRNSIYIFDPEGLLIYYETYGY